MRFKLSYCSPIGKYYGNRDSGCIVLRKTLNEISIMWYIIENLSVKQYVIEVVVCKYSDNQVAPDYYVHLY